MARKKVRAHFCLGNPKIPVDMAGNAMLVISSVSAYSKDDSIAFRSNNSSPCNPFWYIGPTACMIYSAASLPAPVDTASPTARYDPRSAITC